MQGDGRLVEIVDRRFRFYPYCSGVRGRMVSSYKTFRILLFLLILFPLYFPPSSFRRWLDCHRFSVRYPAIRIHTLHTLLNTSIPTTLVQCSKNNGRHPHCCHRRRGNVLPVDPWIMLATRSCRSLLRNHASFSRSAGCSRTPHYPTFCCRVRFRRSKLHLFCRKRFCVRAVFTMNALWVD